MSKGLEELEKIKKFQFTYPILRIGKEKRETTTVGKIFENELSIIEKELKALEIIKDLFDFDFALRFPNNQPMLRITNKRTNEYWEIPISKEKHDLLKEELL